MTARILLFLDIDGVLHSASGRQRLLCRLPVLETWLRDRQNVDIVFSSTWRKSRSIEQLTAMFAADLRVRVVGMTPVIESDLWEPPPMYPRQAEIGAWLFEHAPPGGRWRAWAAIDDQHWLFRPFSSHLVTVADPAIGLTEVELARLDAILRVATL